MLGCISSRSLYQLSRDCRSLSHVKQILNQIIVSNVYTHPSSVSALLSFAAVNSSRPDLRLASSLFPYIDKPGALVFNSLIRGFVDTGKPATALLIYNEMNLNGPLSDNFTFPFVLKACSLLVAVEVGKALHSHVIHFGFLCDLFVVSGLVRMYAEFGEINAARKIFDRSASRDFVLWNSMIGGYLKCKLLDPARELFENMPKKNVGTYNAMIGGYISMGCLVDAQKLFEEMPERDIISWNTMINGHAKFGSIDDARKLFRDAPGKNVTTWSALISGLAQGSHYQDALDLFKQMLIEGVTPNRALLVSVISSCAYLGALDQGIWVHGYVEKFGVELDDKLGSSLIDMYSRCGMLQGATLVFDKIKEKGVSSWSSMIYGLAVHGQSIKALELFDEMEKLRLEPNEITFIAVLCACSHTGLVDRGRYLFNKMLEIYKMKPGVEHYTCMVDILSRAGSLVEAEKLIRAMPVEPDIYVWAALLNGYVMHGRTVVESEFVINELRKFGPVDSGPFVLMSNIYASTSEWDAVAMMRKMMVGMGVKKIPGCSSIELDQVVHEFLSGDKSCPEVKEIYEMLRVVLYIIVLISKFFETYATWEWPTPVSLVDAHESQTSKANLGLMPILMLFVPYEVCRSYITRHNFMKIRAELQLAFLLSF